MKKLYFFLLSIQALSAGQLSAQTFTPIDIAPGTVSSTPYYVAEYNGKVYFEANADPLHGGYELWVSDGTQAGTTMLKDILPGPSSSSPVNFTQVNGKLFFTADDSVHGQELWVTDGTSAGTVMVTDISPGPSNAYINYLTAFGNKLYFQADDGAHGGELWVSDGTSAGTAMVKDIFSGTGGSYPYNTLAQPGYYDYRFAEYNGKLYFTANDDIHGYELWSTDGTTLGTTMVGDLRPGPGSSSPAYIAVVGGKLMLSANDSVHGRELWTSDGTAGGSAMIKDINPGSGSSSAGSFSGFVSYNGKTYFSATDDLYGYELWSTDGTTLGTTQLKDIWPGLTSSYAGYQSLFVFKNKLFFSAGDTVNGVQLWSSDGTASGTTLFKVLTTTTPYDAYPNNFIYYNGEMIFLARIDGTNGVQLWASNGTAAGTHIIAPAIAPNTDPLGLNYNYRTFAIANGSLFFAASFNTINGELWTYTTAPNSITQTAGDHAISASPNPFSKTVTLSGLQSSGIYTVQITDMSGRECYRTDLDHATETQVTMPDLSTGVYLMRVSGQGDSQTFRLVKN